MLCNTPSRSRQIVFKPTSSLFLPMVPATGRLQLCADRRTELPLPSQIWYACAGYRKATQRPSIRNAGWLRQARTRCRRERAHTNGDVNPFALLENLRLMTYRRRKCPASSSMFVHPRRSAGRIGYEMQQTEQPFLFCKEKGDISSYTEIPSHRVKN
jgi:hypothetical protein